MLRRNITKRVEEALQDSPVTLIHGARQTGKTTLARSITGGRRDIDFDDTTLLAAAKQDPAAFVAGLPETVVLDEVQRVPELFVAIKSAVDRDRRPGRFLLTGSANVLMLPDLSESLAGRMEIVALWPLSQGEIAGRQETFLDRAFDPGQMLQPAAAVAEPDLWQRILVGGFPEAQRRPSAERRHNWFNSYVSAILERDVRDISHIQNLADLPRLLQLLATRVGGLLNYSDVSRSLSLPHTTIRRHFALFQATFLLRLLPPWSNNLGTRIVKSPKLYLLDTGLVSSLLSVNEERIRREPSLTGALLENFVVMELTKQATWNRHRPQLFHYRTPGGAEVDIIAEDPAGHLVAIEVKASSSVAGRDFRGIRALQGLVGERLQHGIVLYTGRETVSFGEGLLAVPISALWQS